jgi:glucokinase
MLQTDKPSEPDQAPVVACAIDLGGTNLRAAIVDESGKIHYRIKRPSPQNAADPKEIMRALVGAIRECEKESGGINSIAILVPGAVDARHEIVIQAPNLPGLNGFPLAASLQEEFGSAVLLENDANAAAVGEMWMGAARGCSTIVCITLGTGIGGGIILDGKLWRGVDGSAGEIGHMTVDPFSHLKCGCGNTGCLEGFASATGIVRMARELLPRYPKSLLLESQLSAEKVAEAGLEGDELALEVFKRMGTQLGIATATLVNLLNPEMVVIGGGVANSWSLFEKYLRQEVDRRAFPLPAQRVKIAAAQCGDDAGVLGAARLAFDR